MSDIKFRARMSATCERAPQPGNDELELRSRMLLRGPQGPQGEPGVSPEITVMDMGGGTHIVSITDVNGEQSFTVKDGEDGKSPYIGTNGNWWVWDADKGAYTDTGTAASGGTGGGVSFTTDETLNLIDGVLSVNVTSEVAEDNTLPISSAAVYGVLGNVEVLLERI